MMFDRVRMKEMAKAALKRSYWIVVLVCVLVGLLGGSLAGGLTSGQGLNLNLNLPSDDWSVDSNEPDADIWEDDRNPWEDQGGGTVWDEYDGPAFDENTSLASIWDNFVAEWNNIMDEFSAEMGVDLKTGLAIFAGVLGVIIAIAALFGSLFVIFVSNVMSVSGHGWMLRHWRGEDVGVSEAFAGFRIYKPAVVAMLMRSIYTWLWSLLFVIPGIVKGYAYSMVPYIIYENPNLTANQAIKMSKKMTDGYKFELFVLNLSFFGWVFLSAITGGLVGIFYANPYMGLTHAGTYDDLKWKAIQAGKLTWEDFGQTAPAPADTFADMWTTPAPAQASQAEVWHTPTEIQ